MAFLLGRVLHFFDIQLVMMCVYSVVTKSPTCKLADEAQPKKC